MTGEEIAKRDRLKPEIAALEAKNPARGSEDAKALLLLNRELDDLI